MAVSTLIFGMKVIMEQQNYTENTAWFSGLSETEASKVANLLRSVGTTPAGFMLDMFRLIAKTNLVPLWVDPTEKPTSTIFNFDEAAEKEKIRQRIEAKTGRQMKRFASKEVAKAALETWFEEGGKLPVHPDLAAMTDDGLMAMINAEVKQYRAEKMAEETVKRAA